MEPCINEEQSARLLHLSRKVEELSHSLIISNQSKSLPNTIVCDSLVLSPQNFRNRGVSTSDAEVETPRDWIFSTDPNVTLERENNQLRQENELLHLRVAWCFPRLEQLEKRIVELTGCVPTSSKFITSNDRLNEYPDTIERHHHSRSICNNTQVGICASSVSSMCRSSKIDRLMSNSSKAWNCASRKRTAASTLEHER